MGVEPRNCASGYNHAQGFYASFTTCPGSAGPNRGNAGRADRGGRSWIRSIWAAIAGWRSSYRTSTITGNIRTGGSGRRSPRGILNNSRGSPADPSPPGRDKPSLECNTEPISGQRSCLVFWPCSYDKAACTFGRRPATNCSSRHGPAASPSDAARGFR